MFYFIDTIKASFNEKGKFSAMAKPRADVIKTIIKHQDIQTVFFQSKIKETPNTFEKLLNNIRILLISIYKCVKIYNADIIIQYPFIDGVMFVIIKFLAKKNRIHVLMHDVESIRQNTTKRGDKFIFKIANTLILHTVEMENKVRSLGYEGRVEILHFFDYIINDTTYKCNLSQPIRIVFAGDLNKSRFLPLLKNVEVDKDFYIYLYGKPQIYDIKKHIEYKGFFQADNITSIEGNWGLVWDGTSLETCSGELGEYLRYNAPFKFSLYLAAGMPVIVWKYSALARYVSECKIGICIESIYDIKSTIRDLSINQISEIQSNVKKISTLVRSGGMFNNVLNRLLTIN